ncbi:MAG: hypothetical protein PUB28_12710 [Roseburia sp.]|nr:hypothetical protein [Roseburia sp.]
MDQNGAINVLRKLGYKAEMTDGVLTVEIESSNAAAFQQEMLRARFALEKAGYKGKVAAKSV